MPAQIQYTSQNLKGNSPIEHEIARLFVGSPFRPGGYYEYSAGYMGSYGPKKRFHLTVYLYPEGSKENNSYVVIESDTIEEMYDYINKHLRAHVAVPPVEGVALIPEVMPVGWDDPNNPGHTD